MYWNINYPNLNSFVVFEYRGSYTCIQTLIYPTQRTPGSLVTNISHANSPLFQFVYFTAIWFKNQTHLSLNNFKSLTLVILNYYTVIHFT